MMISLGILLVALLAFANGSNDVSKGVATLAGSGVTDYRRALRWGAAWTLAGALLGGIVAGSLAERFAESLGQEAGHNPAVPFSVAVGSLLWVAFASRTGLPVSTTHAIIGAVLGAGWVSVGISPLARTDVLRGFLAPLLLSPLLALALTFLLGPVIARVGRWLEAHCVCVVPTTGIALLPRADGTMASPTLGLVVDRSANCQGRSFWSWNLSLDQAHWASSALVSLSRGMNDAPKIWALAMPLFLLQDGEGRFLLPVVVVTVALSMALGSWWGGHRVTRVLGERVTRLNHLEGFTANLATSLAVVAASRLGLPVSTTHVSSGAILGMGLGRGRHGVDWRVFGTMATAWLVTLPVAGLVTILCFSWIT